MSALINPHRGNGLPALWTGAPVLPSTDAAAVARLLASCPAAHPTPLVGSADLARAAGVAQVWLKDERARMGLGSFKALGAAYAIAREAVAAGGDPARALAGRTYVAASAGNHGLSVAAGARMFGARAVIVLAETVPESFAERLRAKGAEVMRAGAIYEDSMTAAMQAAETRGWTLLSDSSWPGYTDLPYRVMEGYLQLAAEAVDQVPAPPSHIFLQAGVGGMAAAVAAYARIVWGDVPRIVVVEPEAAPALAGQSRGGTGGCDRGPGQRDGTAGLQGAVADRAGGAGAGRGRVPDHQRSGGRGGRDPAGRDGPADHAVGWGRRGRSFVRRSRLWN